MTKSKEFFRTALIGGVSAIAMSSLAFAGEPADFDIEAGELQKALNTYIDQSGEQLIYRVDEVRGAKTKGVEGRYEPDDALEVLLEDTGFNARWDQSGAAVVVRAALVREANADASNVFRVAQLVQEEDVRGIDRESSQVDDAERRDDVIVVTGTSIRGVVPDSSPVEVYSDLDIARTGATTVEQFIAKLPQNFNGNSSIAIGATQRGDGGFGRNGVDLRGLGVGTTLVLLNGKRLVAPGGRSADLSLISLGAIERIEVLTDGASAIYGSDAVGGVVNIILKDEFEGVDAGFSYGTVTSGSHDQLRADIAAGTTWDSGGISGSYNFFDQSALKAADRDFASVSAPSDIIPKDERHSAAVFLQQSIGSRLELETDILYSDREINAVSTTAARGEVGFQDSEQEQLFVNAGLTYEISDNFTFELFGTYSDFSQDTSTSIVQASDGSPVVDVDSAESGDDLEFVAKLDGALFTLPGGEVRFAAGGGYGDETFERDGEELERDRTFIFGEAFVPIVGPEQDVPGIHRLEITGALRWTNYSEFDSNTSPRVGLLWSPLEGINLRGTYSEAFRAPALFQLTQTGGNGTGYFIFPPALLGLPDPFSTDGSTVYLLAQGSNNPNLGPETSESYTLGFDIDRTGIDGLTLSGTYFNIDYVDRVSPPDTNNGNTALLDPSAIPIIFDDAPSRDLIAELTENATAIAFLNLSGADTTDLDSIASVVTVSIDNRIRNIASSKVEGLDFSFNYNKDAAWGNFTLGGNLTYLIDSTILPVPGSPVIEELNRPLQPVDLRLRAFAGVSRGGFSGQLNLNYVDDYSDPFQTPEVDIGSWTTLDLNLSYDFEGINSQILNGLQLSLNVTNLFDRDPPFLGVSTTPNVSLNEAVGFDPTNANPIGRFIQFGIRKRF